MIAIETILISRSPGETRLAGLDREGRVVLLRHHRPGRSPVAGGIYLGRVIAVLKDLDAALVEIGLAQPGFLEAAKARAAKGRSKGAIGQLLSEGEAVRVRALSDPFAHKGAKLELLAAEGLLTQTPPLCLEPAPDPLFELRAAYPDATVEIEEVGKGRALPSLFARHEVEAAMEQALAPDVALPGGGRLIIETTAALTAIDVDGGPRAGLEASLAALPEIARQIRLRELGGRILVDFAGLGKKQRATLAQALGEALAGDPTPTRIAGITALGLIELVRERRHTPLADLLLGERPLPALSPETVALMGLRAALALAQSQPGCRPRLALGPAAADRLQGSLAPALAETEARLGHKLILLRQAETPEPGYEVLA
ncbi:MAG: ribonuclease E/G [Rhodospirillales bacterium]|nr:ribonuclease E/G [Rhodospirillales bacterium]